MDAGPLVDAVGRERFDAACEWAWRTAADTGDQRTPPVWPDGLQEVPHDLADLWYDASVAPMQRLRAAQELYRQMPCYGVLMYFKHAYDGFDAVEDHAFWSEYRQLLEHEDDRLADPVAYSLWVDFFEDRATVERAWRESTYEFEIAGAERRIERILRISGPVPFVLKAPVYTRLATERRWHDDIARGLVGSALDVYGDLDIAAAGALLKRLDVSDRVSNVGRLRQRLRVEG